MDQLLIGDQAHIGHALSERFENDTDFQASQRSADAEMSAMPKGHVTIGGALCVKDMRIGKLRFIPIRAPDEQNHA